MQRIKCSSEQKSGEAAPQNPRYWRTSTGPYVLTQDPATLACWGGTITLCTHDTLNTLDKDQEHCISERGGSHWHNRRTLLYLEIPGQNWMSGDRRNVLPWLTLATEPRGSRGSAAQAGPAPPTQGGGHLTKTPVFSPREWSYVQSQ